MEHMHYDEADLAGVQAFAPQMGGLREDQSIFTARQLDYVKARVYNKKMPPLKGLQLVPISTDVPEWAETVTYKMYDQVGMAKIVANYADDLPRADVKGREETIRVRDIGDSYGYNVNELRASVALGQNLPTRKAEAARRAHEIKLNQIAMIGDADYGLYGLVNHPNIGVTAGLNGNWDDPATTADEVLADLNALYNTVRVQSKGVHTPDVAALPSAQHAAIYSKRLADSGGQTVAEFFIKQHPGFRFEETPELTGAGTGGTDLIVMYERSDDNLNLDLVMPFNQLPAQARNLELVVPCLSRTAGVTVHYPLALTMGEGI